MSIFTKTETGCKTGDKCSFPYHQVDEQPNKKPKKGYYSHQIRERDGKNAVLILKIVPQLGCVSQDSEALVSQRGKHTRKNPMQKVLGSTRKVLFNLRYVKQVFWKIKGHNLEKTSSKILISEVPPLKFEDRSHEETERQQRCARSKAWIPAKKIQAQRERPSCILLARGRMGTPGCVNKRAGVKRVCGGFRS